MKTFKTFIVLFALVAVCSCATKEKQEIKTNTVQCDGRPNYIGRDKEDFIFIFGTFDRQLDSVGHTVVYWDKIGVSMFYDKNDKVVDYNIIEDIKITQ